MTTIHKIRDTLSDGSIVYSVVIKNEDGNVIIPCSSDESNTDYFIAELLFSIGNRSTEEVEQGEEQQAWFEEYINSG